MLGQRVSNEQSNVGPTKYVAVGPTLNQRLGFGWQMVSVLAGQCRIDANHPRRLRRPQHCAWMSLSLADIAAKHSSICRRISMEGRKEGTCLFDINNHNTEYTSVKILSGDSH